MNISEVFNASNVSAVHSIYKCKEAALFENAIFYYLLGTVIVLSNTLVVFSSGLILTNGQQPRSTYLLLGNLSLSDTILGISIILAVSYKGLPNQSPLCVFVIGLIICPAKVSSLTVGLIAVDRYIYIVHGLYYQRWVSTNAVRVAIVVIWTFSVILSFLPVTGWTNKEFSFSVCSYLSLYRKELVLINATVGLLPVLIVVCLYSIILFKALKTVDKLKQNNVNYKLEDLSESQRKLRNNNELSMESKVDKTNKEIMKSTSFSNSNVCDIEANHDQLNISKSTNDLNLRNENKNKSKEPETQITNTDSVLSICTIASSSEDISDTNNKKRDLTPTIATVLSKKKRKTKSSTKFRAIGVVLLTASSFIISLVPFYVVLILFETCENKIVNPRCIKIRTLITKPLSLIVFINSIFNPIIYAWWHRGFQKAVKYYYKKYLRIHFSGT